MPIVALETVPADSIDVIVVGGGTSGLTLATRIAQSKPDTTVLVLEAGKYHENDPLVDIPGMTSRALSNPDYDWTYFTVPQESCDGRSTQQSHGKGLGGSSMINFMAFSRPNKEDMDAFEKLGNPGWNWDTLLSQMKKSEHLQAPGPSVDREKIALDPQEEMHGSNGPIAKSWPSYIHELHTPILESLESLGVHRNLDPGAGNNLGSFLSSVSIDSKTATRSYAASAYFAPNKSLPNLLVVLETFVTKINFTPGKDGLVKATSVDVINDGKIKTIVARKQVVLSAGSLHTPQLLELSGVGNPTVLRSLGIDCLVDLPGVGENLQDHPYVALVVQLDQKIESWEAFVDDPAFLSKHQELYASQTGFLSGLTLTTAFLPAKTLGSEQDLRKWESATPELSTSTPPSVRKGIEKQYELLHHRVKDHPMAQCVVLNGHYRIPGTEPDTSKRYLTMLLAATTPFSRGNVHATSKDPHIPAAVDPKYLSNSVDTDVLHRVLSFSRRLSQAPPFADSVVGVAVPTFAETAPEDTVKKYIRDTVSTLHHYSGTAAMLPKELGGVVNSELRVYGTENLRIIDASIVPLLASANLQPVVYAVAEKASDILLKDL